MPVQRPGFFGFEGIVYWSGSLFPVNQSAGKWDCTALEITNWITAASKSDDVKTVNIDSQSESIDTTARPVALRGWRQSKRLTLGISVSFRLHHDAGSGELVHQLISAWESGAEIGLAFLDHDAGTGESGFVGNFEVNMSKSEPLRGIQTWAVNCHPRTYIDWITT